MITNRRTNIASGRQLNYERKIKLKQKLKVKFIEYISNNIKEIISIILLFLIGIIISIILINNVNKVQKEEINSYIRNYITDIKEGQTINKKAVFWDSLKNNFIFAIVLWLGGLMIIGIPIVYITILFKGFTFRIFYINYNCCFRHRKRKFICFWEYVFTKFIINTSYICYSS